MYINIENIYLYIAYIYFFLSFTPIPPHVLFFMCVCALMRRGVKEVKEGLTRLILFTHKALCSFVRGERSR